MLKKLATAGIAVTGLIATSSAFALAPNAIDPQNPGANDLVMHWSGATAQRNTIDGLLSNLCVAGTRDSYENDPGDPTHLVVTCTLDSNANNPDVPVAIENMDLYFSYFLNIGSYSGVTPVVDQQTLTQMAVFGNASCTEGLPNEWVCRNDNVAVPGSQYDYVPKAGCSDVEPALFKGSNVPAGGTSPSAAGLSTTSVSSVYQVIFGVGVHCSVLDDSVYGDCTGWAGSPKPVAGAGIKDISRQSIRSIYSDLKAYWEQVPEYGLQDNDGNGNPDVEDFYTSFSPATEIKIYRRVNGSGTNACMQSYFNRQECDSSAIPFTTDATALIPGNVEHVGSSTTIVRDRLDVTPNAIAYGSMEKQPGASYGTNWAMVKIDGVDGTIEANTATGAYDFYCEASCQYQTANVNPEQEALISAIVTAAQDASALAGSQGVLAVADFINNVPDLQFDHATNPVSWTTKNSSACKFPTQVYP
ncbi:MAG: hypothetical protein PVG89_07640 [Gammaproteobacteria bacterium]|jgi:hypothetical protein